MMQRLIGLILFVGLHSLAVAQEINEQAKQLFQAGQNSLSEGKIDRAIDEFTQMSRRFPSLPESYNNLAVIYANQGKVEQAIEMLEKTLEVAAPGHPTAKIAHRNLSNIYLHLAQDHLKRLTGFSDASADEKKRLETVSRLIGQDVWGSRKIGDHAEISTSPAARQSLVNNTPATVNGVTTKSAVNLTTESTTKPAVNPTTKPAVNPTTESTAQSHPTTSTNSASVTPASQVTPSPVKPTSTASAHNKSTTAAARSDKKAIIRKVYAWRNAWISKNVPSYLSYYASDYYPKAFGSRAEWENSRKERLSAAGNIAVNLEKVGIRMDDTQTGSVVFTQKYRAGDYKEDKQKKLVFKQINGDWLIVDEQTL